MTTAEVYLWGTRIGYISQEDVPDIPVFSYDRDFIRSGIEVSPLMMPLSEREYSFPGLNRDTFHTLPGMLADSLPDKYGNRLITRYLSDQGRDINDLTAVERLLYTGSRGMGALEYVPAKGFIESPDTSIDVDALVRLASDILSDRESLHIKESDETMAQILKVGTSAGGARAKALVAWDPKTGDIRSGQVEAGEGYEYWLIKFDGVENNKDRGDEPDEKPYTRIEYAYYLMAVAAGIKMDECRLYRENRRYHFMARRFDRDAEGRKLHMQTLGAIAHYDFNDPGANSYEQAASVINRLGIGKDGTEELFRRMVFNSIAMNCDDHVKNTSFLMDRRGSWTLSPAYDITYAYDPTNRWLGSHQMTISGKRDALTVSDYLECGETMDLSRRRSKDIIDQVVQGVRGWMDYAEEAHVPERRAKQIRKTLDQNLAQ